jgi:hypothetical protein
MPQAPETKSTEPCPKCGQPMEPVHFISGPGDLVVYHGEPPEGFFGSLGEVLTSSPVCTETGMPVLFGVKEGFKFPAKHCKNCRQITIPYGS